MSRSLARIIFALALVIALATGVRSQPPTSDPLPSWNEGQAKKAIVDFVGRVTKDGGPEFVARRRNGAGWSWT
jgi:hypothetical protein